MFQNETTKAATDSRTRIGVDIYVVNKLKTKKIFVKIYILRSIYNYRKAMIIS